MNKSGISHGNSLPLVNLESLKSEKISYCDRYLMDLKASIKRGQKFHERNQNDISSEDREYGWKAIAEVNNLFSVLLEKRMLIAAAKTPQELEKHYNSFKRRISMVYKKLQPPKTLFEEMWDLVSKHSSKEFKS